MNERWKQIEGYSGVYTVSSSGRVRSLLYNKVRLKALSDNGNGYLTVHLSLDGRHTRHYVHRLVAQHFITQKDGKNTVNHLDGNKANNHYNNLEWCTQSKNILHSHLVLKNKNKVGANSIDGLWESSISIGGKRLRLGLYKHKPEAHQAYYDKYLEVHGIEPWVNQTTIPYRRVVMGEQLINTPRTATGGVARYRSDRDIFVSKIHYKGKALYVKESKLEHVCIDAYILKHVELFGCQPVLNDSLWCKATIVMDTI